MTGVPRERVAEVLDTVGLTEPPAAASAATRSACGSVSAWPRRVAGEP